MTNPKTVAYFFEKEPPQWGVRGDPHLWYEMREHFSETPIPATADELISLIEAAFEQLTEHPITEQEKYIRIKRLDHGGMSGGMVSLEFWRDKFIPLFRERFDSLEK